MTNRRHSGTKRLFSLLLALSLCLSLSSFAWAANTDFTDVKEGDYYCDAVRWAVKNGITEGVTATRFGASDTVTRAQTVTFLWRMAGSPMPATRADFKDVPDGAWFADAVNWAADENIANGYTENTFAPDETCTREQVAAFLYRYAQLKGGGFDGLWAVCLDYSDADQIASWAYEPLCWMSANGVMQGNKNAMAPKGACSRGQLIAMLYRFAEGGTRLTETAAPVQFTEKALPVVRGEVDTTETASVRFYQDLPNVPYMSVTDFYNRFYLVGTDMTEGMTFTRAGDVYTTTNFLGDAATFDMGKDTIVIDNMRRFIEPAHDLLLTESGGYDPDYPFAKTSHSTEPEEATPKAIALASYGIDLRGDDTGVYAPLPTLADIFASGGGYYVVYVGEKIYVVDYQGLLQEDSAMEDDPDYLPAVKADRAKDLAQYTYRELCFNMDLWYGNPGQEYIHDDLENGTMDEALRFKYPEIKQMLLATDFLTFYKGLNHLYHGLIFDGGHSGIAATAVQLDDLELTRQILTEVMEEDYGESYYEFSYGKNGRKAQCQEARESLYNGDYYAEKGDTAIIRFDHFIVDNDGWKAFYAGTGERPLITVDDEGNDTFESIGAVLSGLERAAKNPEIKNVIIDVSCNGGGDDTALLAVEWLLTGVGYVRDKDALNSQFNTRHQIFDMNFDGVFDDKDVSPYTGYHYGVLTSKCSFSCGNNFPWFMHEHGAMILGEQSGGGACAIRISGVGGMSMRNSAASSCGVTDKGGSIDNGCPVDANLLTEGENPTVGFYDLSVLSERMNKYFSAAQAPAA